MSDSKSKTKATTLRAILTTLLVLMILVIAGGFYLAQNWLKDYASTIKVVTAQTSNSSSTYTKQLQTELDNQAVTIGKLAMLTAPAQNYQDEIVEDLDKYAAITGVSISNVTSIADPSTPLTAISGVQIKYLTVTLASPAQYDNIIKFIQAIETNLPKMQLTGINLTRVVGSGDLVAINPITIGVYTR